MRAASLKVFRSKIAHNAASLYLVQGCRKLLPLFTLPYLARVLGPAGWGDVAFCQSMGDMISILVEFGFVLSATRDLAQNKSSRDAGGRIASGTFGAQLVLAIAGVTIALVVATRVPLLRTHPKLLCAGLVYGAAQGLTPTWLFQGLERMSVAAFLEIASKVGALAAIFLFVHSPRDDWKVLAFQSIAPMASLLVGIWVAHRFLTLYRPTLSMVHQSLKAGWRMFLLRSGFASYSVGNVMIVAMFAPASVVGFYASAEKISRAITGLLLPIHDAFYPRLSQLAVHSAKENQRLTRISALIEIGCGLILTVVTFAAAPVIIRIVFGPTFRAAVPILQILAFLPLINSLTDAIGLQSLLPAGKESLVTIAIVAGAVVNLSFAFLLAPRYLGDGMAVAVVLAESAVCAVLVFIVARTTTLFRTLDDAGGRGGFSPAIIELSARGGE